MTQIDIVEVSARDGLQNDPAHLSTEQKVGLINRLIEAGVRTLEVASFVNPKRVPQMADAEAVLAALPDRDDVSYLGLVLNEQGVERAMDTKVHEVCAVAISTDTFAARNQNQTSRASAEISAQIVRKAQSCGRKGQIVISAAFGCPFEGDVSTDRIVEIAKIVAEANPTHIILADTIGAAVPTQVRDLINAVRVAVPDVALRCHFHNTRNTGFANAFAALEAGVTQFDASLGGIGGCPFAPKATGNISTEDLTYMLHRMGHETGTDLARLIETTQWLEGVLGRPAPALLPRAGIFPDCVQSQAAE